MISHLVFTKEGLLSWNMMRKTIWGAWMPEEKIPEVLEARRVT